MRNRRRSFLTLAVLSAVLTASAAALAAPALSQAAGAAGLSRPGPAGSPARRAASTGTVTVCKLAGDPALQGRAYPFIEGTWSGSFFDSFSLTAVKPGGTGSCHTTRAFHAGTVFAVEEASAPLDTPPGVAAAFALTGGKSLAVVPSIDFAVFAVGAGSNVLTVTDTPVTPPQPGTLEICKVPRHGFVTGYFTFSVSGPGGFGSTQSVLTNQCNDIQVPPGTFHVAEQVRFPYATFAISANPPSSLMGRDVTNQTADVTVSPGATTTVFFTNVALTGYAKVCKTLARPGDGPLAGHTFGFKVSASFQGSAVTGIPTAVSVVAGSFGTTTCSFLAKNGHPVALPLGTRVTATETSLDGAALPPYVKVVGTAVSPPVLDAGSSTGQAAFFVGNLPPPGNLGNFGAGSVTQATFTDEAFGYLEICKTSSTLDNGTPFTFDVGGVGTVTVPVGGCTGNPAPYLLPVGTTAVTELPLAHTTVTKVTGTAGVSWTPGSATATVTVPFGSIADENTVTFDNEVTTGRFYVCKQQVAGAGLDGKTFHFTWSYTATVNGSPSTKTGTVTPDLAPGGACSLNVAGVPVVNGDGSPVKVTVTEGTTSVTGRPVQVAGVQVQGAGTLDAAASTPLPHVVSSSDGGTPADAAVTLGEGQTVVTFVNGRVAS